MVTKIKKGQMTVWVIVALAIVVVIILFFLLRGRVVPEPGGRPSEDPKAFIGECVRNSVNEVVDIMLPQGGFVSPNHVKMYKGKNVSYICYNRGNYHSCVNEHPLLLNEMTDEIDNYVTPRVDQCFDVYKFEMSKRGIVVDLEKEMDLEVKLGRNRIYVDIDRKVVVRDGDEVREIGKFDISIVSPLYDLGRVAMEIASQEVKYCYFEYVGYMILYPKYDIGVFPLSDNTKIYSIEDKKSEKELNIAIRSCAIPPGI
jgi:hypothetical protein